MGPASQQRRQETNSAARNNKREDSTITTAPFGGKGQSMVVDSGATSHFVRTSDNLPNMGPSNKIVNLPNGTTIQASHSARLPFNKLTERAREAHVLPDLKAHSLISVPKLADEGYITLFMEGQKGVVVYRANDITFTASNEPVLQGCRDISGLWKITTSEHGNDRATHQLNNVYDLPSTEAVIRFLHAAAGFPVKATWITAIKNGQYDTWPNLTAELVDKYFPESAATQKGHMKKQRQNVRSTKIRVLTEQSNPKQEQQRPHREVYIKIYNAHDTIYTDQTGRMPIVSNRGNRLVMVIFEVDSNYIDAEALKDSTDGSLIQAYQTLWKRITASGVIQPKMHILDNEVSVRFKAEIKKNCEMQLVTHRRNLAERAIQTFKNHFVAILSGVDESFPMPLWDRLLPQTVMTLNMLRKAKANPKISAYEYVNGKFDYNRMPLAPMGCAVQVHVSPNRRLTWAEHALDGWYLKTSDEHYRCHNVFIKKSRSERISDTVFFQHRYITNPTVTHEDKVVKALGDVKQALLNKKNSRGKEQMKALKQLDTIFGTPIKKKVTFSDGAQELDSEPRVAEAVPRVNEASIPLQLERQESQQPSSTSHYEQGQLVILGHRNENKFGRQSKCW